MVVFDREGTIVDEDHVGLMLDHSFPDYTTGS